MRRARNRGQSLVELALTLPLLFTLLAATFDMGRGFTIYLTTVHAAREGAWVGSQRPWDTGAIQQAALDEITRAGLDAGKASVSVSSSSSGQPVQVTVTYQYTPVLPFLPVSGDIQIQATETMIAL